MAFGSHLRRGKSSSFVRVPLTGCAGAPRDDFAFKLIFDLYDRTAPQSPLARRQPPELRGACEGSFPRERLCQLSRTVRDWLFSHFRLGPIDQPTRLRCAQAPSQNLGGLERFDLWRLFSKVQLTFPGGPDRGRFSLFPTCTESKPPSPGSRELPPMGGFSKVPGEFTVKSAVPLHRGSMFLLSHFLLVPIDQPTRRLPPPSQNLGGLERFDL